MQFSRNYFFSDAYERGGGSEEFTRPVPPTRYHGNWANWTETGEPGAAARLKSTRRAAGR